MKIHSAVKKVVAQFGLKVIKKLGSGAAGQAFLLDNGKVAKFTVDKSEAYNCTKVMLKKTKYLANIYSVFEIVAKEFIENENNSGEYWLVLLEYLQTKRITKKIYATIPLTEIAKELESFDIQETDFNTTNFGYRNDKIIHFDFGKCEYPENVSFKIIHI